MFHLILTIMSWRHTISVDPSETVHLYETNEHKDSTLNLSMDMIPSINTETSQLIYKIDGPQTNLKETFKDTKIDYKFDKTGIYNIIITNISKHTALVNLSSFTDNYVPDEDQMHIKKITNKLRKDLEDIYSVNVALKELKEINLKALRKDRKYMMMLIVLPIMYILIGFMCFRIQKGFFTPKNNRK